MNNKLDWDDYRIVLLVAEAGTLSGAARAAGTSHPTIFRRLNAIEDKLGVRLFERFRTGYLPTAAGEEVAAAARRFRDLANETERRMAGRDLRPSGLVRIATTDSLLFALIAPEIASLRRLEPQITLDFVVSNEISDLSFREADIAIRPTSSPEDHLIGRKLGLIRQAIYARNDRDPGTTDADRLRSLPWLGPGPTMPYGRLRAWMRSEGYEDACVFTADSGLGLYAAVRAGLGLAILPCYLADPDEDLTRIGEPIDALSVELWMLTHPDLRRTARVRAVLDWLAGAEAVRARLRGEG